MQFQVPQFIETEDRIVGPFSIRQFIYVAIAGAFGFVLYFTVELWLFVLLSVFLVGGALAMSFLKIEGRDLPHVILSAFNFYWKPQTYVWQPEHPEIEKNRESMEAAEGLSVENIISGVALKNAWRSLQTGSKISNRQFLGNISEHYQIFQRAAGERSAARRVDYR